ncbi:MAG: sulfatase-like hydrolase/transferase, partial [Fuerstiella sp.]|nr:sulfatase-like hydrolase/transferase [Fuerstiella sp.]
MNSSRKSNTKLSLLLRTTFIAAVCVSLTPTVFAARPNVLVILTDDQGWGDLSLNGNTNLSTPNIDQLAADGASF